MKKKGILIITIIVFVILLISSILYLSKKNKQEEKITGSIELVDQDIYTYQSKMDEILLKEIKKSSNTIEKPFVKLNPYKISPLSAIIIFKTNYSTGIIYTINGQEYEIKEKTKEHIIPIYYLLPDYNNKIEIKTSKDKNTIEIKTEKLPDDYEKLNVTINNNLNDNNKYFQISPDGVSNVAYDYDGNVVWYLDGIYYGDMQLLDNGHFIVNNGISNNMMGQTTGIVEMDLLGKIYNEYLIDGGVHHEVNVINDNYIIGSSNPNSTRIFDYIYVIDKKGNIKKTIDLYEIVKKVDKDFAETLSDTWAWNNSIYLNNNELIVSLRNKSSILSIDYETLNINWIFGKESNWSTSFANYLLNSTDGIYTQGQHTAYIEDGNLVVFDNGYSADLYENSACTDLVNNYSSVKIFKIDGKNIELKQEYKTDKRMFSYALSSVYTLDNGNKLINFGWEFSEESYFNENCTTLTNTELSSRIVEVDKDFNIIFDGSVNSGKYRAYKYDFNNDKNYEIKEYKSYNNYGDKYYSKISNQEIKKIENEYKIATISTDFYTGFMKVNALLDDNSELYFIFKSLDGKDNYKVISKEKGKDILNMSYLPKLEGKYEIYYSLDNSIYKYENIKEFR